MMCPDDGGDGGRPDLDAALEVALAAAQAGCAVLRRGRERLGEVRCTAKAVGDLTTDVDRASEAAIMERIRDAFPGHALTGEEGGDRGDAPCRWIVDPLDGTVNFVHGLPYYAVSIALEVEGRIDLAVVADPERGEVFTARRGGGAFLNGTRLGVSACAGLDQAVVGTVVPPPGWPELGLYLARFCRVAGRAAGIRRAGAAALDLAYLAAGRLDGFFVMSLKTWDIAAGSLLVTEAGGLVADIDGDRDPVRTNRLVAAGPALLPALRALLREE